MEDQKFPIPPQTAELFRSIVASEEPVEAALEDLAEIVDQVAQEAPEPLAAVAKEAGRKLREWVMGGIGAEPPQQPSQVAQAAAPPGPAPVPVGNLDAAKRVLSAAVGKMKEPVPPPEWAVQLELMARMLIDGQCPSMPQHAARLAREYELDNVGPAEEYIRALEELASCGRKGI